jgi:hypothetical protein
MEKIRGQRARLWFTPEGGSVPNEDVRRSCLSSKGHILKKIPSRTQSVTNGVRDKATEL